MSQFSKLRWLINSWLFLSFYLFFLSKQSDAFGTWETKTTELINPMETSFWQCLSLSNTQSPKAASLSRRKMFLDDHVDNKIFFFRNICRQKTLEDHVAAPVAGHFQVEGVQNPIFPILISTILNLCPLKKLSTFLGWVQHIPSWHSCSGAAISSLPSAHHIRDTVSHVQSRIGMDVRLRWKRW